MSDPRPARSSNRSRRLFAALLALLLVASCVEWEEQEATIGYDAEKERLDVQLVYRGLWSSGGRRRGLFFDGPVEENVESTTAQLEELAAGRQRFALIDPMFEFDLGKLAAEEDPGVAWIGRTMAVDHGDFFRDESGRLCGWQQLHVAKVPELVDLVDARMREQLRAQLAKKPDRALFAELGLDDAESVEKQVAAIATEFRWLALRGTTLAFRMPASAAAIVALEQRLARSGEWNDVVAAAEARPAVAPAAEADPGAPVVGTGNGVVEVAVRSEERREPTEGESGLAFLKTLGVRVVATPFGGELQLDLPALAAKPWRFRRPKSDERFDLAPRLKATGFEVREGVDEAALAREFAWFRAK